MKPRLAALSALSLALLLTGSAPDEMLRGFPLPAGTVLA